MGHSKLEYHLHLVWATYQREPLLTGETEALIYACIRAEAHRLDCLIHAFDGLEDHVHLVVEPPSNLGPSEIAKNLKGRSSRFANDKGIAFKWQSGYSCFSLSRPHLKNVVPYVQNQKHRHQIGNVWPDWEPIDD